MEMEYSAKILIEEVRKRPLLYNFASPLNKNRPAKDEAWQEIADQFTNINASECEKKWRSLRDTYRKNLTSEKTTHMSGTPKGKKWYLKDAMEFLRDGLELRPTVANYCEVIDNNESIYKNLDSEEESSKEDFTDEHASLFKAESYGDNASSSHMSDNFFMAIRDEEHERLAQARFQSVVRPIPPPFKKPRVFDNEVASSHPDVNIFPANAPSLKNTSKTLTDQEFIDAFGLRRYNLPVDEDECFCQSLVGPLKRLHGKTKAMAKIKIMTVLAELEFGDSD